MSPRGILGVVALLAAVAGGFWWWTRPRESPVVEVRLPASFSPLAERGREVFRQACAQCHGENGGGTDRGPPLVHRIYEPSHHADIAIASAIRFGVRQHHWFYGDMPPRPEVRDGDIPAVIAYIRELQRANGIR